MSTTSTTSASEPGTTTGPEPTTNAPPTTSTEPTTDGNSATDTSSTTTPPPSCGDGMLDPDEACDDGPGNGPTQPCTPTCAVNICGDGFPLDPGEACDDGDLDDADECRNDCTLPPACGNNMPDESEQCDDGNRVDTDGCIACKKAVCGDGFVQQNVESCDDGAESPACNADCTLAMCGDTKLNASAGEVCDLGLKNGMYASGCAADCKSPGFSCGDGVVTAPDEICDAMKPPLNTGCPDCKLLICATGHDDCDDDFVNGCETNLQNNGDNCGECGNKCGVLSCKGGKCKV